MKTKPVLEFDDVTAILDACRAEARRQNLSMSIAIVDDGGYPLRLERMDGAGVTTPMVALEKARTAALTRRPTKGLADRLRDEPELLKLDYMPMQGGLPIIIDGHCVGGIGLSGAKPAQDEAIAAAGCAAVGGQ